jgi:hypothetical protein
MTRVLNDGWPDRLLDTIREMWEDGCSAGVIAREVHRSRSAVIGKLYRLGVTRSGANPVKRVLVPRAVRVRASLPNPPPRPKIDRALALALKPLGQSAVADYGCCKFMAMDWNRCCGRPITTPKARYCDAHRTIAYREVKAA